VQFVTYEKKDHVGYITLNRPERLNAVGEQMIKDLDQAESEVAFDDEVWVSVLSGNGRAFCAGFDLKEQAERLAAGASRFYYLDQRSKDALVHGYMYEKWHWKPTIAAIHGVCVGVGLSRAVDCDLRICSDDARFGLPEVQRNIAPIPTVYKLAQIIPAGSALWIALTTDEITAEEAREMGLVGRVVARDQLLPAATELAERLCGYGPEALRATKQFFYQARDMTLHQAVRFSDLLFSQVEESRNATEGPRAFVEKRPTRWRDS
jgi:enoyl-CoA hydratase/carnithine racemase